MRVRRKMPILSKMAKVVISGFVCVEICPLYERRLLAEFQTKQGDEKIPLHYASTSSTANTAPLLHIHLLNFLTGRYTKITERIPANTPTSTAIAVASSL